jgi:hypothetical protein
MTQRQIGCLQAGEKALVKEEEAAEDGGRRGTESGRWTLGN